jgi:hypothetical protein
MLKLRTLTDLDFYLHDGRRASNGIKWHQMRIKRAAPFKLVIVVPSNDKLNKS